MIQLKDLVIILYQHNFKITYFHNNIQYKHVYVNIFYDGYILQCYILLCIRNKEKAEWTMRGPSPVTTLNYMEKTFDHLRKEYYNW